MSAQKLYENSRSGSSSKIAEKNFRLRTKGGAGMRRFLGDKKAICNATLVTYWDKNKHFFWHPRVVIRAEISIGGHLFNRESIRNLLSTVGYYNGVYLNY